MLTNYNTVLVTGGLGFVGRHLVQELLAEGKRVVILDKKITSYKTDVPQGAILVEADIRDPKQLIEPLQGVDLVFHLASNANGSISVQNPRFDFEINTGGTFNILEAAVKAKVKRFYYMSSASVYGIPQYTPMDELHPTRPFVPYGASKLSGELLGMVFAKSQGIEVVAGRPFCIYGPGENPHLALVEVSRYVRWHLNKKPIQVVGDAKKKTRDFVNVSDVIAGILLIADKAQSGEVFNVGSGTEISMRELIDIIGRVTGRAAEVEELKEITDDTYSLVGGIKKLQTLGYTPKVSMEDGIRQLVAYMGDSPELPEGSTIFGTQQKGESSFVQSPRKDKIASKNTSSFLS